MLSIELVQHSWFTLIIYYVVPIVNKYDNNNNNNNNNDDDNNNDNDNYNNNIPKTRKYWVDVQWEIVSSHGERDPL